MLKLLALISVAVAVGDGLPVYYWKENFINFGDYLSPLLVERIIGQPVEARCGKIHRFEQKLLAIGSILNFARDGDIVWGAGVNGKMISRKHYNFIQLDVRAVRGPLTRDFLMKNFGIACPEVYGDPALLLPLLFPEFKKKEKPKYPYTIILHYSDQDLFPHDTYPEAVYATEPWDTVIEKILDSEFIISTSLHGIVVAEAFGIPARLLRVRAREPLFKYTDYYLGTGRAHYTPAYSVEQALEMGGEKPVSCDLERLLNAFPGEFWENFIELRIS